MRKNAALILFVLICETLGGVVAAMDGVLIAPSEYETPNGLKIIDLETGVLVRKIDNPDFSNFPQLGGITYGPDGYVYATVWSTTTRSGLVQKIDPVSGDVSTFIASDAVGMNGIPSSLVFGTDKNLYLVRNQVGEISDVGDIAKFDGETGEFIQVFSTGLNVPQEIVVGTDGNLYVANPHVDNVPRFDGVSGAFLGSFVLPGAGGLDAPTGLGFGPGGDLYVTSFPTDKILRFDGNTGVFVEEFADLGPLQDLDTPINLLFGPDGNLFVHSSDRADSDSDEISIFDGISGEYLASFTDVVIGGSRGLVIVDSGCALLPLRDAANNCFVPANTAPARGVSNITITGTNSEIDAACLGLLQVIGEPRCQYDGQAFPPGIFPGNSAGGPTSSPGYSAGYYAFGTSPWDINGAGDIGGTVGDGKYKLPLIGTVTIDDKGSACDADDTIAAEISYGAAKRNFPGGPGNQGEESWGDGDLRFTLAETVVDSAATNGGGGCDYVIGDAGAPPLLTTDGGAEFGDDVPIGIDPGDVLWQPNDGTAFTGAIPTISTLEVNANAGAPLTVANGPTYVCEFFESAVGDCRTGGSHHEVATSDIGVGDRGYIENSVWVVSTDSDGDITKADVYPVSETSAGGFSQPEWRSPRWQLTGTCTDCGIRDDVAETFESVPVNIDVLANDGGFVNPVTVSIVQQPINGVAIVSGSPGLQDDIFVTYTPNLGFRSPPLEQFDYEVNDGVTVDSAKVIVDVKLAQAADDFGQTTLDTPVLVDILANDQGYVDPVIVQLLSNPSSGTAEVIGSPGDQAGISLSFSPNPGFSGVTSFEYGIESAIGPIDFAVVSIAVREAVDDMVWTIANEQVVIDPLENDIGFVDPVTLTIITNPSNGTLQVSGSPGNSSGVLVSYVPNIDFTGLDSFEYRVSSGFVNDDALVTVSVNGAAIDDSVSSSPVAPVLIDVLANDLGFVDPVSVQIGSNPATGGVEIVGTPGNQSDIRIRYTPSGTFFGTETFSYFVSDGFSSDEAMVSVLIEGIDEDNDGVDDRVDNCLQFPNPMQRDTDDDGYGNYCDGDFDNNTFVNFSDLAYFKSNFGTNDPDADLNGNGFANFADLARFKALFGGRPGPSALAP